MVPRWGRQSIQASAEPATRWRQRLKDPARLAVLRWPLLGSLHWQFLGQLDKSPIAARAGWVDEQQTCHAIRVGYDYLKSKMAAPGVSQKSSTFDPETV